MTRRWAPTLWSARSGDGQGVGAFAYLAVFFCFFGRVGAAASSSPPLVAASPSCVRTAWHSKNTYRERERERGNKHTHTHSLTLSLSLSLSHTRMARLTYIQRERARDHTHSRTHARKHTRGREMARSTEPPSVQHTRLPGGGTRVPTETQQTAGGPGPLAAFSSSPSPFCTCPPRERSTTPCSHQGRDRKLEKCGWSAWQRRC